MSFVQTCMGFANEMAPGVSEGILRAEHESQNYTSSQVFEKKFQTAKNSVFDHFWKIVELNTDVLEPSLLSEIDNWSLFALLKWAKSQINSMHP